MRNIRNIVLAGLLCLTGGCTYSGSIEQSFYKASPRQDLGSGKIALGAAVVRGPKLQKTTFRAESNGYAVDIPLGDPLAHAIESELGTIFDRSGIVDDAKTGGYDLYVYPEIDWIETYRNRRNGHLEYLVVFRAAVKDVGRQFTIGTFETAKKVSYSPPAEAVGAQIITGATLFLLAPLTVPLTTQAVGSEAKDVIGATIVDFVKEFGNKLVEDGTVRDYAALRTAGAKPSAAAAAAAAPSPRAKSKYDDLLDGVVTIRTSESMGSGFFVSSDGYIVTNKHVVGSEGTVSVKTRDGSVSLGEVIARNALKDLALVRVKGERFTHLKLSNGEHAGIGNDVIAIGTPKGFDWSVSRGIISAVRIEPAARYIQTDAAVNLGNSGGPLIDLASGQVVGVNTLVIRKDIAEGLNFAVASEEVLQIFAAYLRR